MHQGYSTRSAQRTRGRTRGHSVLCVFTRCSSKSPFPSHIAQHSETYQESEGSSTGFVFIDRFSKRVDILVVDRAGLDLELGGDGLDFDQLGASSGDIVVQEFKVSALAQQVHDLRLGVEFP